MKLCRMKTIPFRVHVYLRRASVLHFGDGTLAEGGFNSADASNATIT